MKFVSPELKRWICSKKESSSQEDKRLQVRIEGPQMHQFEADHHWLMLDQRAQNARYGGCTVKLPSWETIRDKLILG